MTTLLRAAAVAAVVAFAAFIGYQFSNLSPDVGASPSPSGEATPSQTELPSAITSPSADPAVAALVLRLERGGEAGRVHVVTVLEDGRIITTSYQGAIPLERLLTAAGVQLLRDELDATGLTDTSADYPPVANPGIEPPAYGGMGPALEVGLSGGGTAVITWYLFTDTSADYFEPQPEAEALDALAARLSTLDEWLPASAWADANARPYLPARYRIFIYSTGWGGSLDDLPVESATVSWPLIDGIDVFGDAVEISAQELRCRVVSGEEGSAVIEALEAAGATLGVYSTIPGTSFGLGDRATRRVVTVTLEPILPRADTSCGPELTF